MKKFEKFASAVFIGLYLVIGAFGVYMWQFSSVEDSEAYAVFAALALFGLIALRGLGVVLARIVMAAKSHPVVAGAVASTIGLVASVIAAAVYVPETLPYVFGFGLSFSLVFVAWMAFGKLASLLGGLFSFKQAEAVPATNKKGRRWVAVEPECEGLKFEEDHFDFSAGRTSDGHDYINSTSLTHSFTFD